MMSVKDAATKLLAGNFTCACGSTEFHPRKSATLRCARCNRANFEAGVNFKRVLDALVDPDFRQVRKYLQRLLRKDWPKCPSCKRRFRSLQKHISKKHPTVLFAEVEKELF